MRPELLRFAGVGFINTALDLAVYLVLQSVGVPFVFANLLSTSTGLAFSFMANRSFTFRGSGGGLVRQGILFLVGTGAGLWVLQPLVIAGTARLLAGSALDQAALTVVAKLTAIAVGMTWNWVLYSRVIFRRGAVKPRADIQSGVLDRARTEVG